MDINKKVYIPLHCHNTHSELDGYGTPEQHLKRASEMGLSHIAITNHNHLGGVLEFKDACEKYNIKPILGCELYYTDDNSILALDKKERDEIALEKAIKDGVEIPKKATKKVINSLIKPYEYDNKQYHILFLAKNQNGWKNLVKLQSEASIECTFNARFLVDNELMRRYSDDLICTTACLGSKPANYIMKGEYDKAEELILEWKDIFKENFYLEVQPLAQDEQIIVNEYYIKWSKEHDIKLVATNDVHYPRKEDNIIHDILLCIGLKRGLDDENRMKYKHEFWIKDYDEMMEGFLWQSNRLSITDTEDYINNMKIALSNTELIANQIEDISLGSDVPLFPNVKLPDNMNADEALEYESFTRFYEYAKKTNMDKETIKHYQHRLHTELEIIKKKNYSPYFLAVEDYINESNKRGCSTGPSRGSAAGSFSSFINGIVKVTDPLEHDLLFFRFLTEDRTSPPDYLMF